MMSQCCDYQSQRLVRGEAEKGRVERGEWGKAGRQAGNKWFLDTGVKKPAMKTISGINEIFEHREARYYIIKNYCFVYF